MTKRDTVTESEARSRTCIGPAGCGLLVRAGGSDEAFRMCAGSGCMAWRWLAPTTVHECATPDKFFPADEKQGIVSVPAEPPGPGWLQSAKKADLSGWHIWYRIEVTDKTRGYCGLAGPVGVP